MSLATFLGLAKPAGEGIEAAGRGIATVASGIRSAITGDLPPEAQVELARVYAETQRAALQINMAEAQHTSVFVAGWRPALGWVIALRLFYQSIVYPLLVSAGVAAPDISATDSGIEEITMALLGIGTVAARTWEKYQGVQDKH